MARIVSSNSESGSNCRICGNDAGVGTAWHDANGNRYCSPCLEDLRRQPPYQSPLFKCDACNKAWPLRTLTIRQHHLLCRNCGDATIPKAVVQANEILQAKPVDGLLSELGPPPETILPRITCPHCWHVFPADEILWASEHAAVRGDPVLGPEAQLRFRASRFTADGEALDAFDMSCRVLCCPRCHLSIPRSMLEIAPLFVSVIGAPASGKSHYLAAMAWECRRVLRDTFGVAFNDADALFNQTLNEYEQTLFLQNDPNQPVSIRKTEMQGGMYDQIHLGQQVMLLPKPFLFTLRPIRPFVGESSGSRTRMMCLYDNAGEHFQPGMDTSATPGTQHLAKSRVLWFVFDPTQHTRFREQCRPLSTDPQLHGYARTIRQEVLLNEAVDRIRKHAGLSVGQQYDRPLVVIVSKADIWGGLLGEEIAREPWIENPDSLEHAALDIDRVERVSASLRELLRTLSPEFVAAAEASFKTVVYIPVSSLGRGPELVEATGSLGVRPRDIGPKWVTVPVLYMLARWSKGWIPVAPSQNQESADTASAALAAPTDSTASIDGAEREKQPNFELYYTSAPRGLRPGSSGFSTVAMTAGTPLELVERLERLSHYEPTAGSGTSETSLNPVAWSHWRVPVGAKFYSVLSRVAPSGADYSGRRNKLAYHLVVQREQRPAGGPAWALQQPGLMADQWHGEPRLLSQGKRLPRGDSIARPCANWQESAGDAGWAGILAASFVLDQTRPAYLICPPGLDPLPLLEEAIALLPEKARWHVTFSTHFTILPAKLTCIWRCVTAGTPQAEAAFKLAESHLVLDLTRRGPSPDRPSATRARLGMPVATVSGASTSPSHATEVVNRG